MIRSRSTVVALSILFAAFGVGACASGGSGGGSSGAAYSSDYVTGDDLAELPDMTLYEFLQQHSMVRMEGTGGGQVIQVEDKAWRTGLGSKWQPAWLYVNGTRDFDPLGTARLLSIHEITRLQFFSSTDASARFGGDGYTPVIAIQTR